ncbi:MAG TPA: CinA family protein [Cyclobacteriaceae bacterium]|nr:CinA family protein [Cyclobacteriaceae bacterium]
MVIPYDETLINSIRDLLISRGQTISVAESVTSGHLQAALSFADNALQFYQGGITAYNAGQKTRHLQVEPIHALTCDCVSEQTAVEMARGSNQLFLSEYAIGITGYATPQPEDGIHELFAFVAIARRQDLLRATRLLSHEKHPLDVQVDFTNQALKLFLTAIQ